MNLAIALALVPLTINAIPAEDYAFLSMALSLSVLSAYADLGIGLAIVNTLAGESHKTNPRRSQKAVSVVWFTLIAISLIALALTAVLSLWVERVITEPTRAQYHAILLGAAFVFAGLPSGLVQRVLFARHRTTEANLWTTGGRLASLAFVWISVNSGNTSLAILIFGVIGIPILIGWVSLPVVLFRKSMISLLPRRQYYDRRLLKPYILTGLSFLILQIVPYFEVGVDPLLAGTLISISIVPALDIYIRLFTYIPALASIALLPVWPAIAQAKSQGDMKWISKIRTRSYLLVLSISSSASILLLIYSEDIVATWTGKKLFLTPSALYGMATFATLVCIGSAQSMILNGLGSINQQAKIYLIYLVILIIAKSCAALNFGLEGMLWALNICCLSRIAITEKLFKKSIPQKQQKQSHPQEKTPCLTELNG